MSEKVGASPLTILNALFDHSEEMWILECRFNSLLVVDLLVDCLFRFQWMRERESVCV
jgi:hypothetical protein